MGFGANQEDAADSADLEAMELLIADHPHQIIHVMGPPQIHRRARYRVARMMGDHGHPGRIVTHVHKNIVYSHRHVMCNEAAIVSDNW